MRKILKGIITSVFALSLILPLSVTTANAENKTVTAAQLGNPTTSAALFSSGTGIDTPPTVTNRGLGSIGTGDTLTVDLTGVTINGGARFSDMTNFLSSGKKIRILGGTFVLAGSGNCNGISNLIINEDNVTFENTTIITSAYDAIVIDGTVRTVDNTKLDGVIIDCGVNKIGITAKGTIEDLTINNCTLRGRNSLYPVMLLDTSATGQIDNLIFTKNIINDTYINPPQFSGKLVNAVIDGNYFHGTYTGLKKAGLYSNADSSNFQVINNDFKNCSYALGILSSATSRNNLAFRENKFYYNDISDPIVGIREFTTATANIIPPNQATHNYFKSAPSLDESSAQDYWFSKTTSTTDPVTPPTYFPGYYYPPTTTTPATKVDDPFVYVFKDTPIVTPTPTPTPTDTTSTTTRRNRTDGTTRSSRNANAVINASNKTLVSGSSFNFKEGVTAFDNGGNGDTLTNKVTVTGSINTQKAGTYPITYKVTGANGVTVSKVVNVVVKAK